LHFAAKRRFIAGLGVQVKSRPRGHFCFARGDSKKPERGKPSSPFLQPSLGVLERPEPRNFHRL